MTSATKNIIIEELKDLPEDRIIEILDFIRFLKVKIRSEKTETHEASSKVLSKEWNLPEEDEAWKDL